MNERRMKGAKFRRLYLILYFESHEYIADPVKKKIRRGPIIFQNEPEPDHHKKTATIRIQLLRSLDHDNDFLHFWHWAVCRKVLFCASFR